ncbi:pyrimidine reductase family protein [Catenuloplanes atrovinosus]|uniref:Riboflavin biosynthesis pyrimidine reductase n=1 Tax=Catenuloplanes atrovinosus TaxID=137266 RepID=A0AAE3YYH3_9ACTN|nr:pyrimidine reductase family protein [Catenuloplanes atrovinosus]MDR7280936.1 riboflavin biosynthesis pyrimidine reductase [Catenuloplanes atrovinosus]
MRSLLAGGDPVDLTAAYAMDRPSLRVNFVASADGAATLDGRSGGLGNANDQHILGLLRRLADVLVVGAGTLRAEGYGPLVLGGTAVAWRRDHGMPDHPRLAVVSARLHGLGPEHPSFAGAPVRPLVVTVGAAPEDRRRALADVADVLICGDDELDAAALPEMLAARGLPGVLCEGGPTLFGALVAADRVDELCLTLSPWLAGAGASRIVAGPPAVPRPLTLRHVLTDDELLFLRYARQV